MFKTETPRVRGKKLETAGTKKACHGFKEEKKKGMLWFSIGAVNESVTEIGILSNPTLSFSLCILSVRGIPLLQFRDCFLLSTFYGSGCFHLATSYSCDLMI